MNKYKNIRTVEDILNLKTGEEITATTLLDNMDSDDIVLLRRELRTANRENKPILVCAECGTKLELRCNKLSRENRGKDFYFFKHYKDVKECSIKTDSKLPKEVLLARKYENQRESIPHINLKNQLGYIIEEFHSPEKINIDDKFYFDKNGSGERRKPDVYAVINGKEYVFEIQLNTTFLSVIEEREAFYERNGVSVIWIFNHFPLEESEQRLTQKDIYVPNRLNAFVLDEEMLHLSVEQKELHFKVFYKTFYIDKREICSLWNNDVITLGNLTYSDNHKPFFYDSYADKAWVKEHLNEIIKAEKLELEKVQRIQRQKEEELAKQEQIRQTKRSRCEKLINILDNEIELFNEETIQVFEDKKMLENKIEKNTTSNLDISRKIENITDITNNIYDYLKNLNTSTWFSYNNPLSSEHIASLKSIYFERIKTLTLNKAEAQKKLKDEIHPRKKFIDGFSTKEINGIIYSIIPSTKDYIELVKRFSSEIKIIETTSLGTLFEANYVNDLPDVSHFTWQASNGNNLKTFLIDFSQRKAKCLADELEQENQLKKLLEEENQCMSELKNDIIKLLQEEQSMITMIIQNCKENINRRINDLPFYSERIQTYTNRKNKCIKYLANI